MAVGTTPSRARPARLARGAPTPVHLAAGVGARSVRRLVLAHDDIELVASPRHAAVLLVAGALPESQLTPLARVHDQLPGPRATVWVSPGPPQDPRLPAVEVVRKLHQLPARLRQIHAELTDGSRDAPLVTAATHPVAWLGAGDFGQGGEGMMGGTPYGRPMAMPADDLRDGLALDALSVPLGPFLPWLPSAVRLDVVLQGDVVQRVDVVDAAGPDIAWRGAPIETSATSGTTVRELEVARSRSHLTALAHLLWLHGLVALAGRAARLATTVEAGRPEPVARLARLLRRTRALDAATAGVGRLDRNLVATLPGGPIARAAGVSTDARSDDPTYTGLGFEPLTHTDADARARWRQLLAEVQQALVLAGRAHDERPDASAGEHPHGQDPVATRRLVLAALTDLLPGLELGRAATTVASLDLCDPAVASVPLVAST